MSERRITISRSHSLATSLVTGRVRSRGLGKRKPPPIPGRAVSIRSKAARTC